MAKILDVDFKNKKLAATIDDDLPRRIRITNQTVEDLGNILDKICYLTSDENYNKQIAVQFGIIARKLKYLIE